jgi:hypothetical protein
MAFQSSKNKSRAVTVPAKGDAPNTGAPGFTPAPTRKYVNPTMRERDPAVGYGNARDPSPSSFDPNDPQGYGQKDGGPVSVDPGVSRTSPLADELRRVAAESDAGDLLGDIAAHGTARDVSVDLQSLQTRPYSTDQKVGTTPGMKRQTTPSKVGDVTVGKLPAKSGTPAAQPVRKPS